MTLANKYTNRITTDQTSQRAIVCDVDHKNNNDNYLDCCCLQERRDGSILYDCILGEMDGIIFNQFAFSAVFSIIYQINLIPIPIFIVFFFHPTLRAIKLLPSKFIQFPTGTATQFITAKHPNPLQLFLIDCNRSINYRKSSLM